MRSNQEPGQIVLRSGSGPRNRNVLHIHSSPRNRNVLQPTSAGQVTDKRAKLP